MEILKQEYFGRYDVNGDLLSEGIVHQFKKLKKSIKKQPERNYYFEPSGQNIMYVDLSGLFDKNGFPIKSDEIIKIITYDYETL